MARRTWSFGVGARLLLAFLGIAAFAVLAAAAGLYAFREVGGRLEVVEARLPRTVSAIELSRSAERIIAAAPALLAASDRAGRDAVKAELTAEVARLNEQLRTLKRRNHAGLPLQGIEPLVSELTGSLEQLETVVARRLEVGERIGALRREVFAAQDGVKRLLGPWLTVMENEIDRGIDGRGPLASKRGAQSADLASLVDHQRSIQAAQTRVSTVADMLAEASTVEQPKRLDVLAFQLRRAMRELDASAARLDPRLKRLFEDRVARLGAFVNGSKAIVDARRTELALLQEGERQLTRTANLSAQLTAAVNQLGHAAKDDIAAAIEDALAVQRLSARALLGVVALSLLTSGLIVWLYVGRSLVRRLTALGDGMLAIADGRLRSPVPVTGSDEIGAMGRAVEVFRRNAIDLERLLEERKEAATELERQVKQRTRELRDKSRQLEQANSYKSQFLASASHDLRQPLHALNLFVAKLHVETDVRERERLVGRIDAAIGAMNELFDALLDMAKLEAGTIEPQVAAFPVAQAFERVETTFAETARQKGLRLSVVPSVAWVRSDLVLLERILANLVSNAVRCTARGGVVVGCRQRGSQLRIDVCDSGPGIPSEHLDGIFKGGRGIASGGAERGSGLGLGLAIVDRLGRLLGHEVTLASRPGRGTRFSLTVPLAAARAEPSVTQSSPALADPLPGKLVMVIDDDALALDGLAGLLRAWGCDVVTAETAAAALDALQAQRRSPDIVVSDYRLANGTTGIKAIEQVRGAYGAAVPAVLISADTAPERLRDARDHGLHLLHKPVSPIRLRALLNQLLRPINPTRNRTVAAE